MFDTVMTLKGHIGNDPKYFESPGKTPYCTFRLAVRTGKDGLTQWFTVKAFADLATNTAQSASKGMPVLVRGRLDTETYTTTDNPQVPRTDLVIRADSLGVELSKGTVSYEKNPVPSVTESAEDV